MEPGQIIVRRFEIEQKVGSGGMGTVYRARDLDSGDPVAVKRLDIKTKTDSERFAREAALLADLSHPGIVRYVAHGRTENGEDFIAMEWLEGKTLGDRMVEGPLSLVETVQLGTRMSAALAVAHDKGVVHRDIKPPNLFLPDGDIARVKLLDFGVARITGPAASVTTMTRTGALIGTPAYMAPEQARGERRLDARADLFSMGAVLFQCLTGKPPFAGANIMAVLAKILLEEAPRVREIRKETPEALDQLIARLLEKEPEDRPGTVAEVGEALGALSFSELQSGSAYFPSPEATADTKPPSLTDSEQRILCVVLAGDIAGTEDTWTPGTADLSRQQSVEQIVEEHGGVLDPLVDGSTLIHFSGDGTATDLAAGAARCALALRAVLGDSPIVMATGRGEVSRRMPVGDVIDRAARTLESARAGEVRIDPASAGLLELRFDVTANPSGYLLAGEKKGVGGARTLLGRPTACVGRDRELVTLEATLEEVIDEPIARAVIISGAPGLGKSRVAHELMVRLEAREEEVTTLTAQGEAHRASSPFYLLATMIRGVAGITESEPFEAQHEKLRAMIARSLPPEEVDRVTAFLGEVAHMEMTDTAYDGLAVARRDSMLMGDAMRTAWLDWLGAELAKGPILMILEDLHHADLPTVRFVEAALKNHAETPLMVLALASPTVKDRFPKLWASVQPMELTLRGLTKKATEKLVRQVMDPDPELLQLVIERCEGNPFFIEEVLRAVSSGKVETLPETVLGMVQARLDELGGPAKRVLRAASVYGPRFWQGGVLAMLGGTSKTSSVSEWLDELVEREIIQRSTSSSFPREREYVFRSKALRDAAYAMLTERDRSLAHRLAAEWLRSKGERDAALLARHFDLGGCPEDAVGYYHSAAEQAIEGNDFSAAIEAVERGLTLGGETELTGRLELTRAIAHYWLGDVEKTIEAGTKASYALAQGSAGWYRAVSDILSSLLRLGETEDLASWVERAATAKPEQGAENAQVICLARTAEHLLLLDHHDLAERLFQRVDEATAAGDYDDLAMARVHRGRARRALHRGDPGAYAAGLQLAYETFESAGDQRNACNERMNMGFAFAELGEFEKAKEALEKSRAEAVRMNLEHVVAWADNNLGNVLARFDLARAKRVEQRAIDAGIEQKDPRLEGTSRIYMSAILMKADDPEGAKDQADRAVALLSNLLSLQTVALASRARAELALDQVEEALASARAAMKHLESLGGLEEGEALVRVVFAEALHRSGAEEDAKRAIVAARDRLTERASKIEELGWRITFLEEIPDHRRTYEIAEAWGVEEGATLRD